MKRIFERDGYDRMMLRCGGSQDKLLVLGFSYRQDISAQGASFGYMNRS
jgi:hypothetical protein